MPGDASDLANQLAEHCEAVCRFYLSNGRREGRYWLVGDTENNRGRSLYVRLASNDPLKPAGKWTDYVAPQVMLRPDAGRLFCEGSAALTQHNLSPSGRVA